MSDTLAQRSGGAGHDPTKHGSGTRGSSHHGSSASNAPTARVVAAWVISLGLHVLLLIIMFALVFPFSSDDAPPVPSDVRTRIVGHVDAPAFAPNQTPDLRADPMPVETPAVRYEPDAKSTLADVLSPKKPELQVIGIGAGGGDFDGLGLSLGGGAGPEFFGVGSTSRAARRIVYVVDRSGSMIDTFGFVRDELKRSLSAMRRSQKFHIIFFNASAPLENPPRRLVSAIGANRRAAFEFIDAVRPVGGTKPDRALARAFALEPDLIYLLSDGIDFDPALLKKLAEWNRSKHVQICTVAYVDPGGRDVLERIAREHNGEFKFVSEYDLP